MTFPAGEMPLSSKWLPSKSKPSWNLKKKRPDPFCFEAAPASIFPLLARAGLLQAGQACAHASSENMASRRTEEAVFKKLPLFILNSLLI